MSLPEQKLHDALAAGDVVAALAAAENAVRVEPGAARHRIGLFQLMCLLGQWQRALAQLDAIAQLDAQALAMVSTYREAIKCEMLRARVFAGRATPLAFGEPQAWLAWLVEALQCDADGEAARARTLREQAFDAASFPAATVDGEACESLSDSDPRLGPVCEAIINGRYYWVPFTALAQLDIEAPQDLRDLVWAPVHLAFVNGGETVGLVPSRYPGSEASADGAVVLARRTAWSDAQPMPVGLGQRVFASAEREFPLLDLRRIVVGAGPASAPA